MRGIVELTTLLKKNSGCGLSSPATFEIPDPVLQGFVCPLLRRLEPARIPEPDIDPSVKVRMMGLVPWQGECLDSVSNPVCCKQCLILDLHHFCSAFFGATRLGWAMGSQTA